MTEKQEMASEIFNNGFNCAQAVIGAFCHDLGLDKESALKISSGFGGGMKKGELCGAVTGSVMALGLKRGHTKENDPQSKEKAYELTREFTKRFEQKYGTLRCKELLGYDPSLENELKIIKEKELFSTKCPLFINFAVEILEDMLG